MENDFRKNVRAFVITMFFPFCVKSQLPAATEVVGKMRVGWNLGNTLEAICGETAWGGAVTSQQLIDSVKAAGFNAVRLPVAWFCHADTVTSTIDEAWMKRVKEVVDYCIKDSMYVVLNMHWDKGWLENRINKANQQEVNKRLQKYWKQIATTFKNYDEHLLFAGANEPNVKDPVAMDILLSFYQTFINTVRTTGGRNTSRTLILQGPDTNIEKTVLWMKKLPKDKIKDRLAIEVHYYSPYQFCLMERDENWGKVFYYWGKDYHSATDTTRNATFDEETAMEKSLETIRQTFSDKGVPVIIGEFGAYTRRLPAGSDQELHEAAVAHFQRFFVKTALSKGLIPFYWDVNGGLFNRGKATVSNPSILNAIIEGAKY